jgi:hypothetical protein
VDSKLPTVGLPYQLLKIQRNAGLGLVPPLLPDGEGLELGESFALPIKMIGEGLSH